MVSTKVFAAVPLLLAQLASACVPPPASNDTTNGTTEYPYPVFGSEAASDPATTGYFINHLCLNVKNLTESIKFYTTVFGLRNFLTIQVSEHFSITYLGHQHGGRNGTGYQTTEELNRQKNNVEGLLELIHVDVPVNELPASSRIPNTFAHIGMVVPDIEATQARLDAYPGIDILKRSGDELPNEGGIANATSLGPEAVSQLDSEEVEFILSVLRPINKPLIFVADPDGNLIEIQPQEGAELA